MRRIKDYIHSISEAEDTIMSLLSVGTNDIKNSLLNGDHNAMSTTLKKLLYSNPIHYPYGSMLYLLCTLQDYLKIRFLIYFPFSFAYLLSIYWTWINPKYIKRWVRIVFPRRLISSMENTHLYPLGNMLLS